MKHGSRLSRGSFGDENIDGGGVAGLVDLEERDEGVVPAGFVDEDV